MGAAIGVFEGARALHVPRRRFAPVKTTNDLLALRSDAYVLHEDHRVELAPERDEPPVIDLDPDYYKLVGDFEPRFPAGPPSLVACERLDGGRRRDLRARRRRARRRDGAGARAHRGRDDPVRIAVVHCPPDREHCSSNAPVPSPRAWHGGVFYA